MNYKKILFTLFIAILAFIIIVSLGMKYNWVRFLKEPETIELALPPSQEVLQQEAGDENPHQQIDNSQFELMNETVGANSSEELIRNDCIRASRRAGVTDDRIFEVVNACVAMSLSADRQPDNTGETATRIPPNQEEGTNQADAQVLSPEEGLELTRKACEIVAAEDANLSEVERRQVVEQCIEANSRN